MRATHKYEVSCLDCEKSIEALCTTWPEANEEFFEAPSWIRQKRQIQQILTETIPWELPWEEIWKKFNL